MSKKCIRRQTTQKRMKNLAMMTNANHPKWQVSRQFGKTKRTHTHTRHHNHKAHTSSSSLSLSGSTWFVCKWMRKPKRIEQHTENIVARMDGWVNEWMEQNEQANERTNEQVRFNINDKNIYTLCKLLVCALHALYSFVWNTKKGWLNLIYALLPQMSKALGSTNTIHGIPKWREIEKEI